MSSDNPAERGSVPDNKGREPPREREAKESLKDSGRDSWVDRLKIALGLKPAHSIRDNLEDALEEQEAEGDNDSFTPEERRILRNLLDARDTRVADVMVPRSAIIGISEDATFGDLKALFLSAGHSRLPVYGETLDDPKGMVHIRDVFVRMESLASGTTVGKSGLVRPVLFAPASKPALDLLVDMQRQRIHMALVIDEYGETDGLVSLEDLIEIIVGNIEDEHDQSDDIRIEAMPNGDLLVDSQADLDEVALRLGLRIEPDEGDQPVSTVGGYVAALLGRLPAKGESLAAPNGLIFTVIEGDARRMRKLRIARPPGDDSG
ncbi:MAG: HlyC/CorC family transporter [Methylobacterium sp.]|nr:HlyC/CorC family transporter [Methylobacterium sp.]MCA3599894.1 HlyC/CorC family transporter [Methylobacterium sp.]MCA3605448.1 HlyC/CorC family transporter [Methylobacterium sp.]MCA3608127.1 HlyC/CorC family transporter [Methylobacterium sp.]MCA3612264.1 HlyC/CorC family transporter [Methylobacterium sp.]